MKRFATRDAWSKWLDKNHASSSGIWMQIAKKSSGRKSTSYPEALDVALCYGWIDGQKLPLDEVWWLQRFVPRGARSLWSKINREKALALIASGAMKPAGLAAIERATKNGQWESAYDSPRLAVMHHELEVALHREPEAKAFFATLNKANRYAILWRVQTAKRSETRARLIEKFVGMLKRGEKLHP